MSEKANQYFNEFQERCKKDPAFMKAFMDQMNVLTPRAPSMTIEELAPYADYVTQKMCTEDDESFLSFANFNLEHLKTESFYPNVCAMTNVCGVIVEMRKRNMPISDGLESRVKTLKVVLPQKP